MNAPPDRRPPLATSFSAPNVFCRPMDPAPGPLVYINGWPGIGKKTVAECLTMLLGKDRSLLIDVRSLGREDNSGSCCGGTARPAKNRHGHSYGHRHGHEHNPLLTPQHPRYFSFDVDGDLGSPSSCLSPSVSSPTSRSASFSSDGTTATIASTTTVSSTSTSTSATSSYPFPLSPPTHPTTIPPTTSTVTHTLLTTHQAPATRPAPTTAATTTPTSASPTSTASPTPFVPTPSSNCSSENLTSLLTLPGNRYRIAILPAHLPDTPSGRATLRAFEASAARAGRAFVCVVLVCGPGEWERRVIGRRGSLGAGIGLGGRGANLSGGGGGGGGGGGLAMESLNSLLGIRSARAGGLGSGVAGERTPSATTGAGMGLHSGVGGTTTGPGMGMQKRGLSENDVVRLGRGACVCGGYVRERRGRLLSVPETGVSSSTRPEPGIGMAGQGLTMPMKSGLTIDVTAVPAFEAALQIVEFVRGLEVEREAEWCSSAKGGAATTPGDSMGSEAASGLARGT
ncbi:hypothetical protein VTI74DRAFT_3330 [Chaetomium olivicolor]